MSKYAVYSKWYWKNGVPEVNFVQDWLRKRRSEMIAEDTILFQVDDHHHCSLTIYASEADFNKERPSVLEERKRNHLISSRYCEVCIRVSVFPIFYYISQKLIIVFGLGLKTDDA